MVRLESSLKTELKTLCIVFSRVRDDDKNAAENGITETTKERKAYVYLQNPKITFWDLPETGTEEFSDLEKYHKQVDLDRCHLFLILTATRFTFDDLKLARKIKSIGKTFFFVRTKIDVDVNSEKRKRSFDEEAVLQKLRDDCSNNLSELKIGQQDIYS